MADPGPTQSKKIEGNVDPTDAIEKGPQDTKNTDLLANQGEILDAYIPCHLNANTFLAQTPLWQTRHPQRIHPSLPKAMSQCRMNRLF